jgi:hypothetical protein
VSGECRRRRGRDGPDLLEDGQLVAHPPVLGQAVALARYRCMVGMAYGLPVAGTPRWVDEEPQDGDVAVRPGWDQPGGSPVVDEIGRDQLADAFGLTVVQGVEDRQPVPIAERPAFQAMLAETDGRRCLARYAALGRELWERAGPLVIRLLSQAAAGDADLRAFADTVEGQRAAGTAMVAAHVAERFGLRPGLTAQEAGDVLWTLTAPEVIERLVVRRG